MNELKYQFFHYCSEMWKRRWSILAVLWLVGMMTGYMAAKQPDIYTSKATVFVDKNLLTRAILKEDVPSQDPGTVIDNVRKTMFARPKIEKFIYATDQDLELKDQRAWESRIASLTDDLVLKRAGQDFYLIEYSNQNPVRARDVVQAVLDEFLEVAMDTTSGTGRKNEETRAYVENQYRVATTRLGNLRQDIAGFERGNAGELGGTAAVASEVRGIQSDLDRMESDRLLYSEEISSLRTRLAGEPARIIEGYRTPQVAQRGSEPPPIQPMMQPVPQILITPEQTRYESFQGQLSQAQAEVASLLQRLTRQHPDVIAAEQRLGQIQAQAQRLRAAADRAAGGQRAAADQVNAANAAAQARYQQEYNAWRMRAQQVAPVAEPQPIYKANPVIPELRSQISQRESRLTVANARIGELRGELRQLRTTMARQPEVLQRYDAMKTEEAKLDDEVERLTEKLETLRTIDNPDRVNLVEFEITEPPQVAVTPAGPNRLLLFGGAGFLALGSALGLAFLRIHFSDTIPNILMLKKHFDLPVLGGVTLMETRGQTAKTWLTSGAWVLGLAAFATLFGYFAYRYHFDIWRPEFGGLLASVATYKKDTGGDA